MKSKLLVFVCLLIVIVPSVVFGADPVIIANTPAPFIPLVGIPGIPNPSTLQFGDYINSLYRLAISIAALLAVFKIVIAGAKYMLDDVVTHKQEAKDEIRGALVGLLIILGAVLILNTVNTDITKNMIAIDTLDTNSSSTIAALLAEAQKAAQDAKNLCTLAGPNCVTVTCDVMGATDIDTCNSICNTLHGIFDPNTFFSNSIGSGLNGDIIDNAWDAAWKAAECTYDKTKAATCDADSNQACCQNVHSGTWYLGNNMCSSPERPLEMKVCTGSITDLLIDGIGYSMTYNQGQDCSVQIAECKEESGVDGVVGVHIYNPKTDTPDIWSTVLCKEPVDLTLVKNNCPNEGKIWDPTTNTCVLPAANQKIFPPNTTYPSTPTQIDLDNTCVEAYGTGWISVYIGSTHDASSHVCQKD